MKTDEGDISSGEKDRRGSEKEEVKGRGKERGEK